MRTKLVALLLALTLLTACGGGNATPVPEVPTPTPAPSASPTVALPLAILVLPADMPQADYDRYQTLIYNLAQASGLRFQVLNRLSPADLALEAPALKVVVALAPDPGLTALTAAAPGVQFLAVGIPDLPSAPNLSTVGASGLPVDQQAFLAGYIAAMVASEWRVGILSQKETPGGEAARSAFENGYRYFCGFCLNQNFPPPYSSDMYPVIVRIPTDALEGEYNAYADILIRNFVNAAYVYPEIATPDLLSYMAQYGILLIGETLPNEDVRSKWVVSIQPDLIAAIKNIFPELAAGKGGKIIPTPLFLADVNPDLLSEGKLRLVQDVLDGLQNGTIGTGVTP